MLKITQFYTSPTAIRALMKAGTQLIEQYDLSSLRILGSVGEPINPEVRHRRLRGAFAHVASRSRSPP